MKNLVNVYKIPLLVSITTTIVLVALTTQREPLTIILMFLISILTIAVVDLDYIFHSYFFDQELDFSKNFKTYIKEKSYVKAILYANENEHLIKEKTIHSALFQSLFAIFTIFVSFSDANILLKTGALAVYTNLLYKYIEYSYTKDLEGWFWAFKIKKFEEVSVFYTTGLILLLILSLMFI